MAVGAERHDEAREHQLVDEHGVVLVDAVVVAILVHARCGRSAGSRSIAVGRLHVAAQLDDEHPAVAVERDLRRVLDDRIGQHRLRR